MALRNMMPEKSDICENGAKQAQMLEGPWCIEGYDDTYGKEERSHIHTVCI